MSNWFEVDKKGLAQLIERRGKSFVVTELIQNAWDENVENVEVSLSKTGSGWVISIIDDSPDGFLDLRDAFTLFKASKKKGNADKRGRFNLGEKLVLALASEANIISTKGQVVFTPEGRTISRHKRPTGTCFQAVFPSFTKKDAHEAVALCRRLIPPVGVNTTVKLNGETAAVLLSPQPVVTFETTLPTEIENEEGNLTRTQRKTLVEVYEPRNGGSPGIYELGIPVVDTDDRYVVNICQKVPLNFERDNVTPAYLRAVRTAVANHTAHLLKEDDTTATWVAEALSDPRVAPETVQAVITKRFGDKVVAYDPSDREANALATAQGYTVIGGGTFSKDQWLNIRESDAVKPAGQVTPSNNSITTSPDGIPPLPLDKWTEDHHRIADYARRFHKVVIGSSVSVQFQHQLVKGEFRAAYGSSLFGNLLLFNIFRLGKRWLAEVTQEELDALLIHEYGHHYSGNHLSHEYYDALCEIGAKLRKHSDTIGTLR